MNIEQSIAELIAALKENTAATRELLSAGEVVCTTPTTSTAVEVETPAAEPAKKRTKKATTPEPEAPAAEQEEEAEVTDTPVVPELPIAKLRASLKEAIKAKMFADPTAKATFADARTKYGIQLIAELADDQVAEFYKEVLNW